MPIIQPAIALSTRQEAFCRRYAASGSAADAARRAGYSGRSARQTGCALLERADGREFAPDHDRT